MTDSNQPGLAGLYAMADTAVLSEDLLVPATSLAIGAGARLVQYRSKSADAALKEWQAVDLLHLCRGLRVPLIINDDVELAATINADGVHLGKHDCPVVEARQRLGDAAIIGASCYGSVAVAEQAWRDGASYVAFGRFFPSSTKPFALQTEPAILRAARAAMPLPICAIGGITTSNAATLIDAGADMLAVAQGLFGGGDVKVTASQFARLFAR
jgi:thiamine-phosphate pyrophosphorylase